MPAYEAYSDVAEEWETVVTDWLRRNSNVRMS